MPKYQLLSALVSLAGDKNNVVSRGADNPITYPELFILRTVHGGDDNVYDLVEIGETDDRPAAVEKDRLRRIYGAVVDQVFAGGDSIAVLPARDDTIPNLEQIAAANEAAAAAMASVRSGSKSKPKSKVQEPVADPNALPPLDGLAG